MHPIARMDTSVAVWLWFSYCVVCKCKSGPDMKLYLLQRYRLGFNAKIYVVFGTVYNTVIPPKTAMTTFRIIIYYDF